MIGLFDDCFSLYIHYWWLVLTKSQILSCCSQEKAVMAAGQPQPEPKRLCEADCQAKLADIQEVKTASGLRYKDLIVGKGPSPPTGYQVSSHLIYDIWYRYIAQYSNLMLEHALSDHATFKHPKIPKESYKVDGFCPFTITVQILLSCNLSACLFLKLVCTIGSVLHLDMGFGQCERIKVQDVQHSRSIMLVCSTSCSHYSVLSCVKTGLSVRKHLEKCVSTYSIVFEKLQGQWLVPGVSMLDIETLAMKCDVIYFVKCLCMAPSIDDSSQTLLMQLCKLYAKCLESSDTWLLTYCWNCR